MVNDRIVGDDHVHIGSRAQARAFGVHVEYSLGAAIAGVIAIDQVVIDQDVGRGRRGVGVLIDKRVAGINDGVVVNVDVAASRLENVAVLIKAVGGSRLPFDNVVVEVDAAGPDPHIVADAMVGGRIRKLNVVVVNLGERRRTAVQPIENEVVLVCRVVV